MIDILLCCGVLNDKRNEVLPLWTQQFIPGQVIESERLARTGKKVPNLTDSHRDYRVCINFVSFDVKYSILREEIGGKLELSR